MESPIVTMRLSHDLLGRANAAAKSAGVSRSDLIRAALERLLGGDILPLTNERAGARIPTRSNTRSDDQTSCALDK
jgi:antitoxin component of RelBE/YafQ-DinJ toxin-antitoxin module